MAQPIKSGYLIFEPIAPAGVANGSLFLDSTNANKLSHKDMLGVVHVVGEDGSGNAGYFINLLDNQSNALIDLGDAYDTASNRMAAFRNGIRLLKLAGVGGDRYIETSSTQITLGSTPEISDVFLFWNVETLQQFNVVNGITGTTVTVPSYTMGDDSLLIWRNGSLMNGAGIGNNVDRYVEASATTITLSTAATSDEYFTVQVIEAPIARQDITGLTGTVLTVPSYTVGNEKLLVFRNGMIMSNSSSVGTAETRYLETSSTQITLALAANAEDVFTFIVQQ